MALTPPRSRSRGRAGRRRAPRSAASMQACIRAASTRTFGSSTIESWSPGTSNTRVAGAQRVQSLSSKTYSRSLSTQRPAETCQWRSSARAEQRQRAVPGLQAVERQRARGTPPRSRRCGTGARVGAAAPSKRGRAAGRAPRRAGSSPIRRSSRRPCRGARCHLISARSRASSGGRIGSGVSSMTSSATSSPAASSWRAIS